MLNIIIPMAGSGSRFRDKGYQAPKPFITFNGKMMIEHVLEGLPLDNAKLILIIQSAFQNSHAQELSYLEKTYGVIFSCVKSLTAGAACTALQARMCMDLDCPALFVDSDNIFQKNALEQFVTHAQTNALAGSLLTFHSKQDCFSYVKTNAKGQVILTREKEPISNDAIAGAYYFAQGHYFVNAAIEMLIYGDKQKGEYYMSTVYNHMIEAGLIIGHYNISSQQFACVGTPEQLDVYLHTNGREE